jgi:hypothetical protein
VQLPARRLRNARADFKKALQPNAKTERGHRDDRKKFRCKSKGVHPRERNEADPASSGNSAEQDGEHEWLEPGTAKNGRFEGAKRLRGAATTQRRTPGAMSAAFVVADERCSAIGRRFRGACASL